MTSVMLLAVVSIIQVVVGLGIGWSLCRSWSSRDGKAQDVAAPSAPPAPENRAAADALAPDRAEALRVVARLRELAQDLGEDVLRHGSDVEAAGAELSQMPAQADRSAADFVLGVVARIVHANARMKSQLASASAKIREQELQLETRLAESRIDALTRIANRRAFDERCSAALAGAGQAPLCLAMIDIDYFKRVNDGHGHETGDEVLKNVAAALCEELGENVFVARYGGEEFAVVFAGQSLAAAARALEQARRGIAGRQMANQPATVSVTVSVGACEWRPGDDAASMLRRADESLYAAKHAGRDRVMVHDGEACRPPPPAPVAQIQPRGCEEPAALLDRPAFFQELRHRLTERKEVGGALSLLLIEVAAADVGEEDFGRRLLTAVRQGDRAARFADRQFAVLLPNAARATAQKAAERIARLAEGAPRIGLVEAAADEEAIPLVQRAARALAEDQTSLTAGGPAQRA